MASEALKTLAIAFAVVVGLASIASAGPFSINLEECMKSFASKVNQLTIPSEVTDFVKAAQKRVPGVENCWYKERISSVDYAYIKLHRRAKQCIAYLMKFAWIEFTYTTTHLCRLADAKGEMFTAALKADDELAKHYQAAYLCMMFSYADPDEEYKARQVFQATRDL
jgi:hypothetical protein